MTRNVPAAGSATVTPLLPTDGWTVSQAKLWLEQNRDEGATCPCCGQYTKTYRRKLYATQVRTLLYAARTFQVAWFHLSKLDGVKDGVRQADFPKLAYWDLIEKQGESPLWRITAKGFRFAADAVEVPETAIIFNGRLQGFEGRQVSISDVLGREFNISEMVGISFVKNRMI